MVVTIKTKDKNIVLTMTKIYSLCETERKSLVLPRVAFQTPLITMVKRLITIFYYTINNRQSKERGTTSFCRIFEKWKTESWKLFQLTFTLQKYHLLRIFFFTQCVQIYRLTDILNFMRNNLSNAMP